MACISKCYATVMTELKQEVNEVCKLAGLTF